MGEASPQRNTAQHPALPCRGRQPPTPTANANCSTQLLNRGCTLARQERARIPAAASSPACLRAATNVTNDEPWTPPRHETAQAMVRARAGSRQAAMRLSSTCTACTRWPRARHERVVSSRTAKPGTMLRQSPTPQPRPVAVHESPYNRTGRYPIAHGTYRRAKAAQTPMPVNRSRSGRPRAMQCCSARPPPSPQ